MKGGLFEKLSEIIRANSDVRVCLYKQTYVYIYINIYTHKYIYVCIYEPVGR